MSIDDLLKNKKMGVIDDERSRAIKARNQSIAFLWSIGLCNINTYMTIPSTRL